MTSVAQMRRRVALLVAAIVLVPAIAAAQSVRVQLDGRGEVYAGVPFVVALVAEGFEEDPQPTPPELPIEGAEVTFLGVAPNVRSSIVIVNNQRTETRTVTFVYRYRVSAPSPGAYRVPEVTLSQGPRSATTTATTVRVEEIARTDDMKVRLALPDRPVSVGETFPLHLDWYLRREVSEQHLVVPMFDMEDAFQVVAGPGDPRQRLAFEIGARRIELPYERKAVQLDDGQYTRFRFTAMVTPIKAGALQIPPTSAVAKLQVGTTRDAFGFRVPRLALFRAVDEPRVLQVRPLPLRDRPPSFSNAVGTAFSIDVAASRTVVRLGEPVELAITVRGDVRLDGLSLPPLAGPESLPPEHFSVPDDPPPGEVSDDGTTKTFRVTVRVRSPEVREVPAIPLSYFDPEQGAYQTVTSEPVALSVKGSAIVGAADVVTAAPDPGAAAPAKAQELSLVGADLSLSRPGDTMDRVLSVARLRPVLVGLYLVPLLLLCGRLWQVRTRARRDAKSGARAARRRLEAELERAAARPARESAGAVVGALKELARALGRPVEDAGGAAVIERLETEGFAPGAAEAPLPAELRDEVRALARVWTASAPRAGGARAAAAALLVAAALATSATAGAATTAGQLADAREAYQYALDATERDRRAASFSRAAAIYAELAAANPDRPALLVDWGNAALGAGDLGTAALAYRRALALDPGNDRAARNLAWVRERLPGWLPRPNSSGAVDSLFFWHQSTSLAARHLLAAAAFAAAVLLLVPWGGPVGRRRLLLQRLALLPAAVWLAMATSIAFERDAAGDAVVVADGIPLRSADSAGAAAALPTPLPAGAEVVIRESRDTWHRVALADGTTGWLPRGAVTRVDPPAAD